MRRKNPLLLAHRGLHSVHRENTLAAFEAAFHALADGIECDVQKNAAGAYVIVHDAPGLLTYTRHYEQEPPLLDAMLASLPAEMFLNLELKSDTLQPSDCPPIYESLRRRPAPGPILVSSFEPNLLPYFKARGVPVGFLVGEQAAKLGMVGLARQIWHLKPDYLNLPILMFEVLGKRWGRFLVRVLRALGFSIAFWTVNKEEEVRIVRNLAEILITDEVESIRRVLG